MAGEALGPCGVASFELQVLMTVLIALNTMLATWLAHRRAKADKRENGKHREDSVPPSVAETQRDRPRRHRNHPPGIQP